jgi:hypothetical protein
VCRVHTHDLGDGAGLSVPLREPPSIVGSGRPGCVFGSSWLHVYERWTSSEAAGDKAAGESSTSIQVCVSLLSLLPHFTQIPWFNHSLQC